MLNISKTLKIVVVTLLTAALLIVVIGSNISIVKAQAQDSVYIYPVAGGTVSQGGTTLSGGTSYNYTDGTTLSFLATPSSTSFLFNQWLVVTAAGPYTSTTNPLSITLNAAVDGNNYYIEATFGPEIPVPAGTTINTATDAIVVVLAGIGGTVSPAPGTYALASASSFALTATPLSGWTFDHWIIGGTPMNDHGSYSFTDTPTNNPYTVTEGYGNTYSYQPVFSPISTSTSPTPTISEFSTASAIIIAAILVIVAFGTYAFTRRTKK